MIVCHQHRFIFVHLHKTGGTSITRALDPLLGWNDVICGGTPYGATVDEAYRQRFGLHKHCRASEIRKVVGEEIWQEYFVFAFVRNPYSRAVSLYTYIQRLLDETQPLGWRRYVPQLRLKPAAVKNWPATKAYLATSSFSEFIRHPEFRRARAVESQFVCLADNEKRELIVDYVGRFESLADNFSEIAEKIGFTHLKLERHNASSAEGSTWQSYYRSSEDLQVVHEICRVDFKAFKFDTLLD